MQNGSSKEKVHTYNKISFNAGVVLPDAPIGEWEVTFVRGKSRISPTQKGDPMVTFTIRLDRAEEETNESYQGATMPYRFIFADENDAAKRNLVRFSKRKLSELASKLGLDLGIIPSPMNDPENDLRAFIEAVEGKTTTMWTTHTKNRDSGALEAELLLTAPGTFSRGVKATDE